MIRVAAIGDRATGKSSVLHALFSRSAPADIRVIDTAPLSLPAADVYILVCDKDLTVADYRLARRARGEIVIALNKADTYTPADLRVLLGRIRTRVARAKVVACAADPVHIVHIVQPDGGTHEEARHTPSRIADLESAAARAIERARRKPQIIARDLLQRGAEAVGNLRRSGSPRK